MAEYYLTTPIKEEDVRKLKVGDVVYISGLIITARDGAHRRALDLARAGKKDEIPIDFEGLAVYHCGPVVRKVGETWEVIAAGPTTSTRMEAIESDFIEVFKVRAVIGKGGMGPKTTEAMKRFGAFYGAFTGGAAALAARAIKRVREVHWLDLGIPEALWVLEVENFGPLVVAIDSHGNNIYLDVMSQAKKKYEEILARL
ncbi:MAG: FumA C-terminus/TtdB family hydratase beta subunit [Candidatus Njordarchaeales archaeon]